MYPRASRALALGLLADGLTLSEVSRRTGASRATIRTWRQRPSPARSVAECPRCTGASLDRPAYAALLGYYLGDGCVSVLSRYAVLRVSCDRAWPGIVADVSNLVTRTRPGIAVFHVSAPGVTVVQAHWKHWPCLFPQHGPGRKHERPIVLEPWQRAIVDEHPGDLLRGLFHSDGARVANWATRMVAGERRRYAYPRWMFVNHSEDILGICTDALDTVGIAWRRPRPTCVAVSRRDDVHRLDALIGPKS